MTRHRTLAPGEPAGWLATGLYGATRFTRNPDTALRWKTVYGWHDIVPLYPVPVAEPPPDHREAMRLALEVLNEILDTGGSYDDEKAIDALRAALGDAA